MLRFGIGDTINRSAVCDFRSFIEFVSPKQIAEFDQGIGTLCLGLGQLIKQAKSLLLIILPVQNLRFPHAGGVTKRRVLWNRLIGLDRRLEIVLTCKNVPKKKMGIDQILADK